jgi:hypothetical protein
MKVDSDRNVYLYYYCYKRIAARLEWPGPNNVNIGLASNYILQILPAASIIRKPAFSHASMPPVTL